MVRTKNASFPGSSSQARGARSSRGRSSSSQAPTPTPPPIHRFESSEHHTRYEHLLTRSVQPPRLVDNASLSHLDITNVVMPFFKAISIEKFISVPNFTFPDLVKEFLASYSYETSEGGQYEQYSIRFRLNNVFHIISKETFDEIFGFSSEGPDDLDKTFPATAFWKELTHNSHFTSSKAQIRDLPSFPLFYFIRTIQNTLRCRDTSHDKVQHLDLFFLWAAVNEVKIPCGRYFQKYLLSIATESRTPAICCGPWITAIARHVRAITPQRVPFPRLEHAPCFLDAVNMHQCGVVMWDAPRKNYYYLFGPDRLSRPRNPLASSCRMRPSTPPPESPPHVPPTSGVPPSDPTSASSSTPPIDPNLYQFLTQMENRIQSSISSLRSDVKAIDHRIDHLEDDVHSIQRHFNLSCSLALIPHQSMNLGTDDQDTSRGKRPMDDDAAISEAEEARRHVSPFHHTFQRRSSQH